MKPQRIGAFCAPALTMLFLGIGWASPVLAQEEKEEEGGAAKYVGARACALACHKSVKQGNQLGLWEGSKHAKAYETLGTPEAKAVAKKKGIDDPQKSEKCLKCHVTAPGVSAELAGLKFSNAEGVGCERCHGAGSLYKKLTIMKDRKAAIAKGLKIPDEKTCLGCHNQESPFYKPFKFEEQWKKIAHPKPKAEG